MVDLVWVGSDTPAGNTPTYTLTRMTNQLLFVRTDVPNTGFGTSTVVNGPSTNYNFFVKASVMVDNDIILPGIMNFSAMTFTGAGPKMNIIVTMIPPFTVLNPVEG
jgi:hypothetical protein